MNWEKQSLVRKFFLPRAGQSMFTIWSLFTPFLQNIVFCIPAAVSQLLLYYKIHYFLLFILKTPNLYLKKKPKKRKRNKEILDRIDRGKKVQKMLG